MDTTGFKFPKAKHKQSTEMSRETRKANFKNHFIVLWDYWSNKAMGLHPCESMALDMASAFTSRSVDELDLDHIENVGSNKDKEFDLLNVQLINREAHTEKTNATTRDGQRRDYRPPEFVRWLKHLVY